MTWAIPQPWVALILCLAAFRITRLVAYDSLTASLRDRLTHRSEADRGVTRRYRPRLDEFFGCAFCVSFWVCAAGWLAWLAWPRTVAVLAVPWAASAVVGLISKRLDP